MFLWFNGEKWINFERVKVAGQLRKSERLKEPRPTFGFYAIYFRLERALFVAIPSTFIKDHIHSDRSIFKCNSCHTVWNLLTVGLTTLTVTLASVTDKHSKIFREIFRFLFKSIIFGQFESVRWAEMIDSYILSALKWVKMTTDFLIPIYKSYFTINIHDLLVEYLYIYIRSAFITLSLSVPL